MAEQFLIPKRLTRRLPWLRRGAWWLEAMLVRGTFWLLRRMRVEAAFRLSMKSLRIIGPRMRMWDRVQRNLAIAFPDLEPSQRAARCSDTFAHLGAAIAELVLADKLWQQREQRFEFRAHPTIDGITNHDRPMVLVTAHVGPWQLTNLVAGHYGFSLSSLYAPESNPYMADMALRVRNKLPCTWISSRGGIRIILDELRSGRSVGLACDTRLDQGEAVSFFGHPAMTNTVPARLALRTGCELVPVRSRRLPGARFDIEMEAPIRPRNAHASRAEQALDMSIQLNARFEEWIRAAPGEWMCLARRWPKELDKAVRE